MNIRNISFGVDMFILIVKCKVTLTWTPLWCPLYHERQGWSSLFLHYVKTYKQIQRLYSRMGAA